MSYVLVEDVPASWEAYGPIARFLGGGPVGLLLHVAGPTDEGFRIIEIWESEAAWRRHGADHGAAVAAVDPVMGPRAVRRDLHAAHVVIGAGRWGEAPDETGPTERPSPGSHGKETGR